MDEAALRARHFKWGRPEDDVVYSILRGEWPGGFERLGDRFDDGRSRGGELQPA